MPVPEVAHHFYRLEQLADEAGASWGRSAIGLAQVSRHGFPVLPGWVLPPSWFWYACHQAQVRWPPAAAMTVTASEVLRTQARTLQAQVQAVVLDRSALTTLQSELEPWVQDGVVLRPLLGNVRDPAGADLLEPVVCALADLEIGIKRLWSVTFAARNLLYWQHLELSIEDIALGVLIQPLRTTQVSGQLIVQPDGLMGEALWGVAIDGMENPRSPERIWIETPTGGQAGPAAQPAAAPLTRQPLGHQSIYYTARTHHPFPWQPSQPIADLDDEILIPYWVPLDWQGQSCFTSDLRQQLLHLGQRLWCIWQRPLQVSWWLEAPTQQLWLVQLTWDGVTPISPPESPLRTSEMQELRGIIAAPGEVLAQALVIAADQVLLQPLPPQRILITSHLTPDWVPLMGNAAGLVLEQGGIASHGAILARELGIPAVVGVKGATQQIRSGDWLRLHQGQVLRLPEPSAQAMALPAPVVQPDTPPPSSQPLTTQLLVTLSQASQLEALPDRPIAGIGLLRSEHLLLPHLNHQHPQHWLQQQRQAELAQLLAEQLQPFVQTLAPRPVWYRPADWRSPDLRHLQGAPSLNSEANPMLGLHGTLSYQLDPAWWQVELQAIAQVYRQGAANLRLLLPFVRTVAEFEFCRDSIAQAQLPNLPLWIMAEVPSVLWLLPEYVRQGVQGITIGMSDLLQLVFALDREQPLGSEAFDPTQPLAQQIVTQLLQTAGNLGIPCHLCPVGRLEQTLACLPWLVSAGLTGLSVPLPDVEAVRGALAQVEASLERKPVMNPPAPI
jgi:pyruvate,water dikinase